MAFISIKREVDLQPGLESPAVFHCSQGDKGTTIMVGLKNGGESFTIPSGATIQVKGSRSNGEVFSAVTGSGQGTATAQFTLTEDMTATPGPTWCEVVLTQSSNVLGTANFVLDVEQSPMGDAPTGTFTDAGWAWILTKMASENVDVLGGTVIQAINEKAVAQTVNENFAALVSSGASMSDTLYNLTPISSSITSTPYRLTGITGNRTYDADYNILKFEVTPGELIRIVSDHKFQFQGPVGDDNAKVIPTSGVNTHLVGGTYGVMSGMITVPDGASWVMVSTPINGGAGAVYRASLKLKEYDSFSTMSSDANLVSGTIARTRGYYAANDGGAAWYIVNNVSTAAYDQTMANGLYAAYVVEEVVNAAAFGAVSVNGSVTSSVIINNAKQCAAANGKDLLFPVDITTSATVLIDSTLEGRTVTFGGTIEYTGTNAAVTVNNCKNIRIIGHTITAESATSVGLLYLQEGTEKTIQNVNSSFQSITARIGVRVTAEAFGILECNISVDKIRSYLYGIYLDCVGQDTTKTCFIGQMRFQIQHIVTTLPENPSEDYPKPYAMRFDAENDNDATVKNCRITGVFIDSVSLESCANGVLMRGDCKLIKIYNIRVLEHESFEYILNLEGDLRYNEFNFTSPVMDNKIYASTSYGPDTKPIMITGGIYSPASYRFANYKMISRYESVYGNDIPFVNTSGTDFTFKNDNASYRIFSHFVNTSGTPNTYNLWGYFSPFGVSTIYVTQNKTDGSVVTVIGRNSAVAFDGSTVTDSGQTTYRITAEWDPRNGTTQYYTTKE